MVFDGADPAEAIDKWIEENDVVEGDYVYAEVAVKLGDGEWGRYTDGDTWVCDVIAETRYRAVNLKKEMLDGEGRLTT